MGKQMDSNWFSGKRFKLTVSQLIQQSSSPSPVFNPVSCERLDTGRQILCPRSPREEILTGAFMVQPAYLNVAHAGHCSPPVIFPLGLNR